MNVRDVQTSDWTRIAWLASNEVQEDEHSKFEESHWIKKRQTPSEERYEFVVESDGQVEAYCSIERNDDEMGYRLFIVLDWRLDDTSIADLAYQYIETVIDTKKISDVWMRELSGDISLLEFVKRKGFRIDKSYIYERQGMVNLFKRYGE